MSRYIYTQHDLEEVEQGAYAIMRARTVQEAIEVAIPGDPPRSSYEYEMAAQAFMRRIIAYQPNYSDPDAPPHIAYRVEADFCPPLALLGDHARVALLQVALGQIKSGLGFVVGLQETACQFGDDNVLMAGAKVGFAVSTLVIFKKPETQHLVNLAMTCLVPLTKRGEPCAENHSWSARSLCINLYTLLQDLANLHTKAADPKARKFFQIKMQGEADEVDQATNERLRVRGWLDEALRRLAYD